MDITTFLCTSMPPYSIADLLCAALTALILWGAFCSHVRMSSRAISSLWSEAERLDRHAPNDPAAERARPRGYPGVRDEWGSAGRATGHGPVRGHGAGLRHCRLRRYHTGSPDRRHPTRVGG